MAGEVSLVWCDEHDVLHMQGPFSRTDILAWFDDHFYDEKLRIRPANALDASFRELSVMLKVWAHAQKGPDSAEPVGPFQPFDLPYDLTCPDQNAHMHPAIYLLAQLPCSSWFQTLRAAYTIALHSVTCLQCQASA